MVPDSQGGREAKLPPSFLESTVLHRLTCNLHRATRRSIGIFIESAILYSDPRTTKLRSGISSPFLPVSLSGPDHSEVFPHAVMSTSRLPFPVPSRSLVELSRPVPFPLQSSAQSVFRPLFPAGSIVVHFLLCLFIFLPPASEISWFF
jgi:hypothetical protein